MATSHPQMITANRLTDGEVVWWNAGVWVEALSEGEIFPDAQTAERALEAAQAFVRGNFVVNPYLFDVRIEGGLARPVREREIIRAAGPSVARHHGKQASRTNV
jgi:hypothetical protein